MTGIEAVLEGSSDFFLLVLDPIAGDFYKEKMNTRHQYDLIFNK